MRAVTLLAVAATVAACSTLPLEFTPAPVMAFGVERLDRRTVRVYWPQSFSKGYVTVYAGFSPETIDRKQSVGASLGSSLVLTSGEGGEDGEARRVYFELVPSSGEPVMTAERRLPLDCCNNFRDIGGYQTIDGRRVRWNRLYRADDLAALTRDDLRYLAHLDIKLVCDFRSDAEREAEPDRVLEPAQDQLHLPVAEDAVDPDEMKHKIRTGGMVALWVEDSMRAAYRSFVTKYSDEWRQMFERISRGENMPTVVHCTAGKDRTGFATALVLLALGVPTETIFDDYLLTNHYQADFFRFVVRWVPLYSFFRTDPRDLLPLLEARPSYLEASLDAMVEQYGSIDGYLERALGVDEAMRLQLAMVLLE